jgi:hypothetical protein
LPGKSRCPNPNRETGVRVQFPERAAGEVLQVPTADKTGPGKVKNLTPFARTAPDGAVRSSRGESGVTRR